MGKTQWLTELDRKDNIWPSTTTQLCKGQKDRELPNSDAYDINAYHNLYKLMNVHMSVDINDGSCY